MRSIALAALLATAACTAAPPPQTPDAVPPAPAASASDSYDLAAARAKIARVEMRPDTAFLNAEERQVVRDGALYREREIGNGGEIGGAGGNGMAQERPLRKKLEQLAGHE